MQHFASLDLVEFSTFWRALAEVRTDGGYAARMLALTWVRTDELRHLKPEEIDGDIWRIPAARMKMGRDHVVPLSAPALEILATMAARSRGSPYVFGGAYSNRRPLSENAVLDVIERLGYKGRMTGHGFRTVASTWANEAGYRADAIERQLAHAPDDKTRAAYNRAEYLPERRKMLNDWAAWLASHLDPMLAQRR